MQDKDTDPILLPLLGTSEEECQALLSSLITKEAEPIAKRIIRKRFRIWSHKGFPYGMDQESEDLYSQVLLQLLSRLRDFLSDPQQKAIQSFRKYVAVTTSHCCNEHFRQKFPQRTRLKNQLHYLLTHRGEFAIWEISSGELVCGFSSWKHQPKSLSNDMVQRLCATRCVLEGKALPSEIRHKSLKDIVSQFFQFIHVPIEFEDAVSVLASFIGIKDQVIKEQIDHRGTIGLNAGYEAALISRIDQQAYLHALWQQIKQLPLRQRYALLVNLRDVEGDGALRLFTLTGITTMREIAATLEMSAKDFAQLWNELPLNDQAIARLLNITRQQVINLRKSARERLVRRMSQHKVEVKK